VIFLIEIRTPLVNLEVRSRRTAVSAAVELNARRTSLLSPDSTPTAATVRLIDGL
jgi:hypothetical protein